LKDDSDMSKEDVAFIDPADPDASDLTIETASSQIKIFIQRKEKGGMIFDGAWVTIGESHINRMDERGHAFTCYAVSGPDGPFGEPANTPPIGGVELRVTERPLGGPPSPRQPAAPAQEKPQDGGVDHVQALLPHQHGALAIIDIDGITSLVPSPTYKGQIEIRITPLDKGISNAVKTELTKTIGPFTVQPDPTDPSLRMADLSGHRVAYKGVFCGDKGGLMRCRVSVWYIGVAYSVDVGHVDLDVTFRNSGVYQEQMKNDTKDTGFMRLGHMCVQETEWNQYQPSGLKPKAFGGGPMNKENNIFPSSQPNLGSVSKGKTKVNELEAQTAKLEKEIRGLEGELRAASQGQGPKESEFDSVMRELGPPSVGANTHMAPGLTRAQVPVRSFADAGVGTRLLASSLARATSLADPNMVDREHEHGTKNTIKYRFCDINSGYNPSEDVWGLVQPSGPAAHHHPKGVQSTHKVRPVRDDCIVA